MQDVGLGYLSLNRRADTLSGGESQRIKIAAELAKAPAWKLEEDGKRALFILDEPTSGLHFNEVALLLAALFRLRDAGHTILCVEHHKDLLNAADYLVDMGPGAGRRQYRGRGRPRRCSVQSGSAHFSLARPPLTTAAPENHSSVLSPGHPVPGVFGKKSVSPGFIRLLPLFIILTTLPGFFNKKGITHIPFFL